MVTKVVSLEQNGGKCLVPLIFHREEYGSFLSGVRVR